MRRRDVLAGALALGACAVTNAPPPSRPLVIAHRGASGERPEHTRAAYELAIAQGADFIEPDLVMSQDGVLICRHENELSGTTDVAQRPEFAARRTTKTIDGVEKTDWFAEDFTLAELRILRCRERIAAIRPANTAYDGQEPILTFAEAIEIARAGDVGIYPELKHPAYLAGIGLDPVPAFIGATRAGGGQALADRLFVQCFEIAPLETLARISSLRFQCVQLIAADTPPWDRRDLTPAQMVAPAGLARIAQYARGVGVEKTLILPRGPDAASLAPTALIADAHGAGLFVHAWTFRAENIFLPREHYLRPDPEADLMIQHGDLTAELKRFFALGVDGVFTDFPAAAVAART